MSGNVIKRPALGQMASLGTFYDARSDTFIPLSLLKTSPPAAAVTTIDMHKIDVKYSSTDTYKDKFERMGVNAELGASFLAGLVDVEGSGRYLADKRESNLVTQASLHYDITTVQEKLNFVAPEVKDCLAFSKIDSNLATHVVAEITWGAQNIVTAKRVMTRKEDRTQIEGQFTAQFDKLSLIKTAGAGELENGSQEQDFAGSFEVTVYGDVLADDGLVPTDFQGAFQFLSNVPKYVAAANNGKGKPITYTLLPLSMLQFFCNIQITAEIVLTQLSVECLESFVQLFDELRNVQQTLHEYHSYVRTHHFCLPEDHILAVSEQLMKTRTNEASLKAKYAETLKRTRDGKSDAKQLWELLEDFQKRSSDTESMLSGTARYTEKVEFIELIVSKGATYVGYGGGSLDIELAKNRDIDTYAFYFNEETRRASDMWPDNLAILLELLEDTERRQHVVLVDCDATGLELGKSLISLWRKGQIVTKDVAEERRFLATKCILRYNQAHLDQSEVGKPLKRRAVKIPCPGLECSTNRYYWICLKCRTPVEFGYVDKYLYCDCGRCDYRQWEFRCKDPKHGPDYEKYNEIRLLKLLEAVEPFDELNILILGQTGVGKSTWINAFVNYLTFPSLDDAMKTEELEWFIPCSFSIQKPDPTDDLEKLIPVDIKVGFPATKKDDQTNSQGTPNRPNQSELDGSSGQSATQITQVYPMLIGNLMVRIIDTPGIGDTRGVHQDNKNMADILDVLQSYENLHGIVILLKPNNARLDLMFKFCIKQLLMHLHRSAAKNIVFGFTNTRGTSYTPGDTFKPLQALLEEYKGSIDIGLYKHNVYCFDSESFRYLAAYKQGEDLGHLEENRESWNYSVTECKRLVDYLRLLQPHKVRGTLNLNETRRTIIQLTQPMAKLAQDIKHSILANAADIKDLETKEMEKAELEKKLDVVQKVEEGHVVDQPRTVCGHYMCVEFRSEGLFNMREQTIIYKTVCHNPCYLTTVTVNTKGHRGLQSCAAFTNGLFANRLCACGHSWVDHLHIMYELRSRWVTIKDHSIEAKVGQTATSISKIENAINEKRRAIAEWKAEEEKFKEAAVKFSVFLKNNSITAYNDETLKYLDQLIEEERGKVSVGAPRDRLDDLIKSRAEHEQEIDILDKSLKQDPSHGPEEAISQDAVQQLIKELYRLKHYGKYLEQSHQAVGRAQESVYREKPRCIRARTHWIGSDSDEWTDVCGSNYDQARPSASSFDKLKQVVKSAGKGLVHRFGGGGRQQ